MRMARGRKEIRKDEDTGTARNHCSFHSCFPHCKGQKEGVKKTWAAYVVSGPAAVATRKEKKRQSIEKRV